MTDDQVRSHAVISDKLALLSQLDELRSAWQECQSNRSDGGSNALSGFEYQFLLMLLKIVNQWKEASDIERQNPNTAHNILTEVISDITESNEFITLTQAKRTLSDSAVSKALEEFWDIFNLASERTPSLLKKIRFVISGNFEGERNATEIIDGWGTKKFKDNQQKLNDFKKHIKPEIVPDPKVKLKTELETLSRDEDTEITIGRWLGYLIQIGSGISPESVSSRIWRELRDDKSLEAFRATLARLFSQSLYRIRAVRHTLGVNLSLPRTDTLSQLQTSVLAKQITLLIGSSGSGKSALCKLSMQNIFQNYTALFLNPKDIFDFTDALDSDSKRETRRIDELITAQAIEKPLIIIDDLGDANDQNFSSVLNLIQNVLTNETSPEVRFILVAHLDAESSICEKIAARIGTQIASDNIIRLPQLPIDEIKSSNVLPDQIANLVQRADEFGPALNMKFLDSLIRSDQEEEINTSFFRNELDLLNWYWVNYVGNGNKISEECHELIKISLALAEKFTPDLSKNNLSINSQVLYKLIRLDCLRIAEEKVAITHRFVGDCARFRYLLGNCRDVEVSELVTKLKNPLWSKPIRWFALYLAMESEETEIWQELFQEALAGEHLQLVDVLLDGAILSGRPQPSSILNICVGEQLPLRLVDVLLDEAIVSRQPSSVLNICVGEQLPFLIERLFYRLFAIATYPNPYFAKNSQSMSAGARLVAQEQILGIPKVHLWQPIWRWLLSLNQEVLVEKPKLVFNAGQAWLNWGFAEQFPLRVEVAELVLNLSQKILLPDTEQQKRHWFGDASSSAFACIVFAQRLVPDRSTWLLRTLAGREITPATRLESTETSSFLSRPGIGVLEPAHPKGPLGKVNHQFRKFMLEKSGLYLDAVTRVNSQLGAELLLALTIAPPSYSYELDDHFDLFDDDLGTEGSDDIDVCTFKFLPLLSLLKIDEELAVDVVETLCQIATNSRYQSLTNLNQRIDQSEINSEVSELLRSSETDPYELILMIGDTKKKFQGGRYALYWHRNYSLSSKIVNCFLMTLEGWFYSRPTREELENSISLVLSHCSTVAMLGVLISLAKWDISLLNGSLLPLISSLQLLVWLEFEQIDHGQNFGFDSIDAWNSLSKQEYQELLEFNQFPYRKYNLQNIILHLWLNGVIPSRTQAQILSDWDNYQLADIPEINKIRALRIRELFETSNWQEDRDNNENQFFRFNGTFPEDANSEAESARWYLSNLQIVTTSRRILDGKMQKTPELHNEMVTLLTSEEQLNSLKEHCDEAAFLNVIWAAIAIILEPPIIPLNQELEVDLDYLADRLSNTPILLDETNRSQTYNLNAEAFISHVAPKLLKRIKSESSFRTGAFRCLIGVSNCNTSTFMRSWIKEYGLTNPLTQELINLAPRMSRLIALSYTLVNYDEIRKNLNPDGTYIFPHREDIAQAINNQENPQIHAAWSILQKDFVEKKLTDKSIIEISEWIPEILVQPLQECPGWLRQCFDWKFLAAALIPVLETQPNSEISQNLVYSLREQVIFALLHTRERIYIDHKATNKKNIHNSRDSQIYESQSKILDVIIISNYTETTNSINIIIDVFKMVNLVDCVILKHIVRTLMRHNLHILNDSAKENISPALINESLKKYTAFAIGQYLFELKNKQESDLRIIGKASDVWEELIKLLSEEFQENNENTTNLDTMLTDFFERFQDVLLSDWWLRRQLYQVGKIEKYKQFRRILFKALIQHQELLPNSRNDESELLVQVIAELWDSDKNWIINKQSRRDGLRTSLGQLQEIDAVGARRLSDEIADFLIHHPN